MHKLILIRFYIISISCLLFNFSFSQNKKSISNNDTIQLSKYSQSVLDFTEVNKDSAFYYGNKAIAVARKLNQKYYEGLVSTNIAYNYITSGDYTNGLKYLIEATKLAEDKELAVNIVKTSFIEPYLQKDAETNKKELQGYIKNALGILYGFTESPDKKLKEMLEAKHLVENVTNDMFLLAGITENIVGAYMDQNKLDSALYYERKAIEFRAKISGDIYNGAPLINIVEIYRRQGKMDSYELHRRF